MTTQMHTRLALLLTIALTNPVLADAPATPREPTYAQLTAWHDNLARQYKSIDYLDADQKPIDKEAFLRTVEGGRRAFKMTASNDAAKPNHMRLQVLSLAEATPPPEK